jgi:hypothetical protein
LAATSQLSTRVDDLLNGWKAFEEAACAALRKNRKLEARRVFQGLNISIENDTGSTRSGIDKDGKPWSVTMTHPYGYIRLTEGVDGDHVDCFLGPVADAKFAYIIHTNEPATGEYDEDKVMLGFANAAEAVKAFLDNYSDGAFFRACESMPMDKFKEQVLATKDEPATVGTLGVA